MKNKILIVEDEQSLAHILKDFLENEKLVVKTAYTAKEAYELFDEFEPTLIILDIMLPDDNGMELCRQFRNESDVPILMLSAKNTDFDKILSLGLGADDYLTKPFSPAVVVAHVKALLRRYNKEENKSLDHLIDLGDFVMNKKQMMFSYRNEKVDLTNKEFELLWQLAKNPSEVFAKEILYDLIWGEDEFGELSTVTVHIRKIRSKIESKGLVPGFIKTIWGVGYKFELD